MKKLTLTDKIYVSAINKQKEKIKKLEKEKKKVFVKYPTSMYKDDIRDLHINEIDAKIKNCNLVIQKLRLRFQ